MTSVLVVDDIEANRELVQLVLAHFGYVTVGASGAVDALSVLSRMQPDVVITDVFMPDVDGFALAREIRSSPSTRDIPILFYSAEYLGGSNKPPADLAAIHRIVPKNGDLKLLVEAVEDALTPGEHRHN